MNTRSVILRGSILLLSWVNVVAAEATPEAAPAGVLSSAAPAVSVGSRLQEPRQPDGPGRVTLSGEFKQWHKMTLTVDGPYAHELDNDPNPFTDYRLQVVFVHESGSPRYDVPGYFAADGDAANTSAQAGTTWRAQLSPDKPGRWAYTISFLRGSQVALEDLPSSRDRAPGHGQTGSFVIVRTDKTGSDLRAKGRLQYVGVHHLQFADTKEYWLKAGPDAPENLLAYVDFDGTRSNKRQPGLPGEATPDGLKTWAPHIRDWRSGDPTWKGGKGKGLIGALNYLAGKGCNSFSFLPYNAGGDGDDVWPFVERDGKCHYDCSKLDQWGIVFDHATARGLHLHFKLQENEMDDNRRGERGGGDDVPESLDGGKLGPERRLYCRELIARFAHNLAMNWNLGEENTQSTEEVRDMAGYLNATDPYAHPIVIHTFPNQQETVYPPLLGNQSALTGASLQNSWSQAHQRTLKWIRESARAGKPWVVANDEQNPADMGVPPDPGYQGHSGEAVQGGEPYTLDDIRKYCLWGTLMAGGAGVEYYFGYKLPQNDLVCQDWRSRDKSWDYCRIALEFFREHRVPFWEMRCLDELVGNPQHDNSRYCFAHPGQVYLVFLPTGGSVELDLTGVSGSFSVQWFNPRAGGGLDEGSVTSVKAGNRVPLGDPPAAAGEDWLVMVRR
ncbi:MAG TPA: DUF5060 domain-containing protein [Verrucomicrobiota bacterium]|nr:DUF5060 domain-containing protein [Verrucomicrobiota bacterium]HNU50968.1 DUF5060 domain-containing protein [Verrucomicrobiota bacterium]